MATEIEPTFYEIRTAKLNAAIALAVTSTDDIVKKNLHFDILMGISYFIYEKLAVPFDPKIINLDNGSVMAGNLYTFVQFLNRKKNEGSTTVEKYAVYKLVSPIQPMTTSILCSTLFNAFQERHEDAYKKIDFQILMPIIVVVTNFKTAFDEIRMGLTTLPRGLVPAGATGMRRRTATGTVIAVPISAIGLGGQHVPLLHGLTFPPQKKMAMLTGLGPMTLAAMLHSKPHYPEKIANAFKSNLAHVPMINDICDALILNKENSIGLMTALADYLLIVSHKGARSFYFPLEFYMIKTLSFENPGLNGMFSFDGMKMLAVYCDSANVKWTMRGGEEDADKLRQVVFHAMFTEGLENFAVLKATTTYQDWLPRRELTACLQKRKDKNFIEFIPIWFKYISKGTRAEHIQGGNSNLPCMSSNLVFFGKRERVIGERLRNYLRTGKVEVFRSSDVPSIISALNTLKRDAEKEMSNPSYTHVGGSIWYKVEIVNNAFKFDEVPSLRIKKDYSGYFYV